jgi:hypothetical protein
LDEEQIASQPQAPRKKSAPRAKPGLTEPCPVKTPLFCTPFLYVWLVVFVRQDQKGYSQIEDHKASVIACQDRKQRKGSAINDE